MEQINTLSGRMLRYYTFQTLSQWLKHMHVIRAFCVRLHTLQCSHFFAVIFLQSSATFGLPAYKSGDCVYRMGGLKLSKIYLPPVKDTMSAFISATNFLYRCAVEHLLGIILSCRSLPCKDILEVMSAILELSPSWLNPGSKNIMFCM